MPTVDLRNISFRAYIPDGGVFPDRVSYTPNLNTIILTAIKFRAKSDGSQPPQNISEPFIIGSTQLNNQLNADLGVWE